MKREFLYIFCLLLLGLSFNLAANGRADISFSTTPELDDELNLNVELDLVNYSRFPVSEVRMYYRDMGDAAFEHRRMISEGFRYLVNVDLAEFEGSVVEYFFDVSYVDGSHQSFPLAAPDAEMFNVSLRQNQDDGDGIVVISPEPGETIYTDEFLLTVSFFPYSSRVDPDRTKLFLNAWDVSRYTKVFDEFMTFTPRRVPPGSHKIIMELYDTSGRLITRKEWSFSAVQRKGPSPVASEDVTVSGDFYAESRSEELVDGLQSNHYARSGLRLNVSNGTFDAGTRVYISNQESSALQPINRYTGWVQANFWNERYIRLTGGDTYPRLNPFILNNVFLRGFHGSAFLKFINLDFATGKTKRAVEGSQITVGANPPRTIPGTFQRDVWAARASFGAREIFQFGLTAAKGKDDVNSIQFGRDGEESANFGADVFIASFNNRFNFEASYNISSYNPNIQDGVDVARDTLLNLGVDIDQGLYDLATDVITVNQYLIVQPAQAYQAQMRLNYFNNRFSVLYRFVQNEYYSLGQPFLLRDNKGLTITDNIRLFQNQLFLNVRYQNYENNLTNVKATTTTNNTLNVNFSYFPLGNLPTLTFGYNNHRRDNKINSAFTENSAPGTTLFTDDNTTNTLSFSSSYAFLVSNLKNRLTLNLLNYNRQDDNNTASGFDNLSNTLSFILQTRYNVPLKTHLELNFQQTDNSVNDTTISDLSVSSFGLGVEYRFPKLFNDLDKLSMAVNGRMGLIETNSNPANPTLATTFDYNRSFLNGRLIYTHSNLGRISLNGDLINYTGDRQFKDYIITARYDVRF